MKFSELLNFKPNNPANIKKLSNLGAINFGKGISDKNQTRTPHYEISETIKAFNEIPIIKSSVEQLISFIIPNKDIRIASKDEKSVKFLEQWHNDRYGFLNEVKNLLTTNVICGNGYLERHYAQTTSGEKVLDNAFSLNDASRVYVNPDDVAGPTAFLFKVPVGIKNFVYMGEEQIPTFRKVKYIKNYNWCYEMVYSIVVPYWKIIQYSSGWTQDNLYGSSPLTASIDACNIFQEIMSSWDTIAKTRQIDQKLLSVDTQDMPGMQLDDPQLAQLQEQLSADDGNSYKIIGMPLKFLQTDISTSQGFNLMEGVFDLLRRQIMMSLLPQHLTPWNDSATTQGSESAMPPFMLRLKAKQNELIKFLNHYVLKELRKTYTWLAEDITYVFDEPKVMDDKYYIDKVVSMTDSEIITKEEAREYLKQMGILDSEIFDRMEEDDNIDSGANNEKIVSKEATFKNINKYIQKADDLKTLSDVTKFVYDNKLNKEGECQNISALYGYVDNSNKGISTVGHVAFVKGTKVYDPIRFKKVPIDIKEWKNKYKNNKDVKIISLKKPKKPEQKTSELFTVSEAIKKADVGFNIFKQRLKARHKKKDFSTEGWKQIFQKNVGGHNIRLIDATDNIYLLFDGLTMIETYDKDVTDKKTAVKNTEGYIKKVEASFDEFTDEETDEDKAFNQLQKEIEEEYKKRLDKFFKQIPKTSKKTENFLSDKIFGKLNDVFKGFNSFIKSRTDKILNKLNTKIVKDSDEEVLPTKTIDNLKAKNKLMTDSLAKNLQQVKDSQVSTIRTKLANGIAAGHSVSDIKSDIEKDFNYDKGVRHKIDRAIQTSGRNATRITKLKMLQSQGFEEVLFITRDDSKVRPQHAKYNNKVISIKQMLDWYTNNTIPGTFYNCRCTFVGY